MGSGRTQEVVHAKEVEGVVVGDLGRRGAEILTVASPQASLRCE